MNLPNERTQSPLAVRILEKCMFLFLTVFPFGFAAYFGIRSAGYSIESNVIHFLPLAVLAFILVAAFVTIRETCSDIMLYITLGIICAAAFVFRIFCGYMLDPVPYSDFNMCYQFAVDGSYLSNISHAPYSAIYALVLRVIVTIFGPDTFPIMVFQSLLTSCIPAILFFTCQAFTSSKKIAIVAAAFYAFNPAMALYTTVMSTENISPFFFSLTLLCFAKAYKARGGDVKKSLLFSGLAALFLGCTNLFKPVGSLMIIAFIGAEILLFLIPAIITLVKQPQARGQSARALAFSLMLIFLMPLVNSIVFNVVVGGAEQILKTPIYYKVDYSASSIGSVAYFGLSPRGGGMWHTDVANTLWEATYRFNDAKKTSAYLMDKLIGEIKEVGMPAFLSLIKDKINLSWSSEWMIAYYSSKVAQDSPEPSFLASPSGYTFLMAMPTLYTNLMNIGAALCFAFYFFRKKEHSPFIVFAACMLGVVFLAFTILEAQGRYKSTFVPLICIVASIGYIQTANLLWQGARRTLLKLRSK